MQILNIMQTHIDTQTQKKKLLKKTFEHLRSLCCMGAFQDTPNIMSLRKSLESMGNDEKNATLMAILKQGVQDHVILKMVCCECAAFKN